MSVNEEVDKKVKKLNATELRKVRAKLPISHAGQSFGHKHELFIAKLKRGELWALNHLSPDQKKTITPLFEVWPSVPPRVVKPKPGQKFQPVKPAKPFDLHIRDLLTLVSDEWTSLPFFLDTQYVPKGGIPTDSAVKTTFNEARKLFLTAVPVTALRFTPAFQAEIAKVIASDGHGVMIRLHIENFTNPSLLPGYLTGLLGILDVPASEVDILIDLKHRPSQAEVSALGQSCLSKLPEIEKWRTVTLAAGCFPSSISDWDVDQWLPVDRSEWLGWNDVRQVRLSLGVRLPSYGDYGVRCGGPPLSAARRPAPNLRYTCESRIITRKGSDDDGQIKAICASLVQRPEFSGATFSQGDDEILLRANALGSPNNGQAEQWIQWATNHHLTMTAIQLHKLA